VICSRYWDNGTTADVGAVTWGNGAGGTVGTVMATNSLTGSLANDLTGSTVTALTNGHYVVGSPNWNNGAGAATWGNGETGGTRLAGTISANNSLIGSSPGDGIGTNITALTNGNFVASSGYWDKVNADNSVVTDAGAVTWCNGDGGTVGTASATNSLIGSTKNDYAGSDDAKSNNVTALTNGNYVVSSKYWDNEKAVNAGAVTWGNSHSWQNREKA